MKNHRAVTMATALAGTLALAAATQPARAANCGDVLTADMTLDADLECVGTALLIGADGITLDLNGHTLTSLDGLGVGVDIAGGYDGVTIKNGAIDGFQEAVYAEETSNLTLKDLDIPSVSGTGNIPNSFGTVGAIHIVGGEHAQIRDSSISGGPIFGPTGPSTDAILLESVQGVTVDGVDVVGGFSGIDFGSCGNEDPSCPPLGEQFPSSGTVRNCTFTDNWWGVVIINAVDTTVTENTIVGADQGIRAGFLDVLPPANLSIRDNEVLGCNFAILSFLQPTSPGLPGPISGLVVNENHVHDNGQGIGIVNGQSCEVSENQVENNFRYGVALFTVSSGNTISENTVTGSSVFFGIGMTPNLFNPPIPGPSGNLISENTANGNNAVDLFHSGMSTPNIWSENCFSTSTGADIGEPICDKGVGESADASGLLAPLPNAVFLRGDSNTDNSVDLSDPLNTLNFLFLGGRRPSCEDAADANDDGDINISDALYTLSSLFSGGPDMPPPYPHTGVDLTPDRLSCEQGAPEVPWSEFYCAPSSYGG